MDTIAVIDFGGQYAHLIANRIRRLGVHASVLLPEMATPEALQSFKGIVLSGGPASVTGKNAATVSKAIFTLGVPVLAICYGHQLTTHLLGGKVVKGKTPEYGPATLNIVGKHHLLAKLPKKSTAWMSHFDEVTALPPGFELLASTASCKYAAIAGTVGGAAAPDADKKVKGAATKVLKFQIPNSKLTEIFSVQFHPEVAHTQIGAKLIANFVELTGAKKTWTMAAFLKNEIARIRKQVGDRKVFLLVSGGVDSTVAFALLEKALGKKRVFGLLVDHGLMRENEAEWVKTKLAAAGFENLHVEDARKHFAAALKNALDPEDKRRIIGRVFLIVQRNVLKKLYFNQRHWLLGQGTIYPDTIESGGTKNSDKIKTHHNRVPEIEKMLAKGLIVEPLAELYKDEVRAVGRELGLPAELVERHPFPGPGLGVRILCAAEADKLENTSRIEAEVRRKWGVPAKVLPVKSVGVQGDERTYRHPVVIFTKSRDWTKLDKMATEIIQKFPEINRVLLCLTQTEAPRTYRFKGPASLTRDRIALLQAADTAATAVLQAKKVEDQVWQMPVVLAPVSSNALQETIILRPVESSEAMTASFSRLPAAVVAELAKKVSAVPGVEGVLYDLTNKPPGTIEWE